jgi:hypothetical protein
MFLPDIFLPSWSLNRSNRVILDDTDENRFGGMPSLLHRIDAAVDLPMCFGNGC